MTGVEEVAAVVAAVAAVGTGVATYVQSQNQAAVDQTNAQIEQQQGQAEEAQIRLQTEQQVGAATNDFAASDVDPNTGSPKLVRSEIAGEGALRGADALYNARLGALGLNFQASQTASAGTVSAGASFLQGASKAYDYTLPPKTPANSVPNDY